MRIALCDDQIEYAETLLVKLKSFEAFSCAKLDLFSSGDQLLQSMEKGNIYDLFFLDIDMPGIDGLELGKRLNSYCKKAIIIFVTNHEKYAIDAFDCDACGYLLKNCDEGRFSGTIEKAIRRYRVLNQNIFLDTETGTATIPVDSILHIEYSGRRCHYHTTSGEHIIRRSLNSALSELQEFGFIRIHQYRIVNLAKIRMIQKNSLVLVDNSIIELSRYRRNEALQKYVEFRKEKL